MTILSLNETCFKHLTRGGTRVKIVFYEKASKGIALIHNFIVCVWVRKLLKGLLCRNFQPIKMSNSAIGCSISVLKGVAQSKIKLILADNLQSGCNVSILRSRRVLVGCGSVPLVTALLSSLVVTPARAVDESEGKEEGVIGAIVSLFNPNEKTKSGIVLPKDYLKSAREVVRTLRDSLKETPKDNTEFRRNADAAKEAIREYLNEWKGQKTVVNEESYVMIEKAIRSLAKFYSKAGPSATLPDDIKAEIIGALDIAQQFL